MPLEPCRLADDLSGSILGPDSTGDRVVELIAQLRGLFAHRDQKQPSLPDFALRPRNLAHAHPNLDLSLTLRVRRRSLLGRSILCRHASATRPITLTPVTIREQSEGPGG